MSALYHPYLSDGPSHPQPPVSGFRARTRPAVKTHYALRHFRGPASYSYPYLCEMLSQSAISAVAHFPPERPRQTMKISGPPETQPPLPIPIQTEPQPNPKPSRNLLCGNPLHCQLASGGKLLEKLGLSHSRAGKAI